MRFFSKFTVLCNASFLVAMIFRYIEISGKRHGNNEQAIPLPWLESIFVILGYGAVIVNALFLLVYFIFYSLKVNVQIPRWIIIFNIAIFCCQLYFHFFFK